ncbi:COX15/CtaA family protein [Nesterenkonia haasae]|uniref:COX15/CtaA family protein n=1 Tax=Nesterenkonia haasae TaxID=2587813 RepID=UPI0013911558|nr:COX15/CtaA family protein [Nesterenkonia haasae]NDK30542.1 heme A synthase [Nesterenkonia haasae]
MEVIRRRLPSRISRLTKILAWATLVSNIGIILTGGAVRLTDSGLGCPEWPRCTADSWVSTPEMGIHGAIEFGNRLLTYVLIIISVAMFLAVIRLWSTHRALVVRTIIIGFGIPLQGIIGGITVWTDLNPWVVGLHFLASAGLVLIATQLLTRVNAELRNRESPGYAIVDGETNNLTRSLSGVILVTAWASLVLGTVVTGTGPHAGDPNSPRHDFDLHLVTQLHVVPVYMLCAAAVVLLVVQRRLASSTHQRRAVWFLVAVIVGQGALGYWQYFAGLPVGLVWLHMLGSALAMVAATQVFDRYRSRYMTRGLSSTSPPVTVTA